MKVTDVGRILQRPFFLHELGCVSVAPDDEIIDLLNAGAVAHLGMKEMERKQLELRQVLEAVTKYTKNFLDKELRIEKIMRKLADKFMTTNDAKTKERYNRADELEQYFSETIAELGKLQSKIKQLERENEKAIQQQYREKFAANLKQARLAKRMSQKDLAARLGITAPSLSQIENAIIEPSLKNLIRISNILHTPPNELLLG